MLTGANDAAALRSHSYHSAYSTSDAFDRKHGSAGGVRASKSDSAVSWRLPA